MRSRMQRFTLFAMSANESLEGGSMVFFDAPRLISETLKFESLIAHIREQYDAQPLLEACQDCNVRKDKAILSKFNGKTLCDVCLGKAVKSP